MAERKLGLDRQTLAKITGNDPKAIRALEQVFTDVDTTPSTVEEAAALAGQALSITQTALTMIGYAQELLDQLAFAPAQQQMSDDTDMSPAVQVGTLGAQNADAVEITGGSLDGTPVGATTSASGKFTTFGANGKVPQGAAALGPAATDLPTVITLANNIRAALIANGIGS